jgi:hypothetical protein
MDEPPAASLSGIVRQEAAEGSVLEQSNQIKFETMNGVSIPFPTPFGDRNRKKIVTCHDGLLKALGRDTKEDMNRYYYLFAIGGKSMPVTITFKGLLEQLKKQKIDSITAIRIQFPGSDIDRNRYFNILKNGMLLQVLSPELRGNRDIVLAPLQNVGSALEFTSDVLRAYKNIVLGPLQNVGSALQYASENLRSDRDFIIQLLKDVNMTQENKQRLFSQLSLELQNDSELRTLAGL